MLNPGPDIVVCDEGHRIKNAHATISKALKKIKTRSVFNVQFILPTYPLLVYLAESHGAACAANSIMYRNGIIWTTTYVFLVPQNIQL